MLGELECPRCDRVVSADGIWIWVHGQGERLRVEDGTIRQSGRADVFDLPCGCKFNPELWDLGVRSAVSTRGGTVEVRVVPRIYLPEVLR